MYACNVLVVSIIITIVVVVVTIMLFTLVPTLRWLDTVFQGQYLHVPSLSVNCDTINKDLAKLTPQLY